MRLVFNGVFLALLVLLVGFAVWCGIIVRSVSTLRADLSGNIELLLVVEDIRAGLTAEGAELAVVSGALDRLGARPALESRVGDARAALIGLERGEPEALPALNAALAGLTGALRGESAAISVELGGYWDALYGLVVASLLLLASNMGMLLWARDRHLRLEVIQERLVKLATRRYSETAFTASGGFTSDEAPLTSEHPREPTVLAEPESELPPEL